ncbi:spermidine resistance protein [Saitozyma podzolica]|uniref:adenosylmethionine decarboxylase n=1 Tax=Saitozyma podzolica TaxID=1890683 RepID=A0A427XRT4_9TREE|nr:spermidine resistance protein [Saitozyma podzolica]
MTVLSSTSPLEPTASAQEALLSSPGPFEGPEKLLEVWFAPSPEELPLSQGHDAGNGAGSSSSATAATTVNGSGRSYRGPTPGGQGELKGLRRVPREVWEEMLDIVKCKVLSVVEGEEIDAYLLSESSLFVAPHLLILKTCGTTLNLLGLHRIIEIAREYCGLTNIWRCFYSRKSFFFPDRQQGPHKDWRDEVKFLDGIFGTAGSAYTVGPMNRDHWLLSFNLSLLHVPSSPTISSKTRLRYHDTTLEILMSHLSPAGRAPFFLPEESSGSGVGGGSVASSSSVGGHELGRRISSELGIDGIFPGAKLDSFGFDPCGYSANAVVGTGGPSTSPEVPGGGYFTIHVTPEEGWSYASFECNVPLPNKSTDDRPDLSSLIQNVVSIFQPNRLSITLFVSTPSSASVPNGDASTVLTAASEAENQAWRSFGADLLGADFVRKDRIGYEFDGYDLVFACFEKRGWVEPKPLTALR